MFYGCTKQAEQYEVCLFLAMRSAHKIKCTLDSMLIPYKLMFRD